MTTTRYRLSFPQYCVFLGGVVTFVMSSVRLVGACMVGGPLSYRLWCVVALIMSLLTFRWLNRHAIPYEVSE